MVMVKEATRSRWEILRGGEGEGGEWWGLGRSLLGRTWWGWGGGGQLVEGEWVRAAVGVEEET